MNKEALNNMINIAINYLDNVMRINRNEFTNLEKEDIKEFLEDISFRSCKELYEENKQLQQRIDKAIELINNKKEDINNGGNDMCYTQLNILLEILKGE